MVAVAGAALALAFGAGFGPVLLAPALTVYTMAGARPLRHWLPLTALLVPMVMAGHRGEAYLGLADPAFYAALVVAVALVVMPVSIALLRRTRAEGARESREEELRRYAYEERLQIAREVHDVVGHSLTVITLQAGVALHLLERSGADAAPPADLAASLEAIRSTSKDALAELRTAWGSSRPSGCGTTPGSGLRRCGPPGPGWPGWVSWSAPCGAPGGPSRSVPARGAARSRCPRRSTRRRSASSRRP